MTWIEPLNLEYWTINVLAGSVEIWTFLAFIFISGLAAYFRMNNIVFLMMVALFGVMMSIYISGLYIFILILTCLAVFYSISKIVK